MFCRRLGWVIPVVGVLLASCGSADESNASVVAPVGVSDFQYALLEDGQVTFDEYEKSILALVQCLNDSGVPTSDLTLVENGTAYAFNYAQGEDEETTLRIVDNCETEYSSEVRRSWAIANTDPTDAAEADEFYERVIECLRSNGVEIQDSTPRSLSAALASDETLYLECFDAVSAAIDGS